MNPDNQESDRIFGQVTLNCICVFIYSGISAAEAEFLYIREVECLDGFGQESFSVKVSNCSWNGGFPFVSAAGVCLARKNMRLLE